MAINNVDIYGDEWLELVFANRNKSYGAYELRKHYSATVLKALAVTFGFLGVVALGVFLLLKPAQIAAHPIRHEVTNVVRPIIITQPTVTTVARHLHHHTRGGHSYSPAPDVVVNKPQIQTTQAPVNVVSTATPAISTAQPEVPNAVEDKAVYPTASADVRPLPVGGAQGWANYLQKNLVYPEAARRQRISGKVQLSFVVEKDGSISDITVEQAAGHGFDEEAVRVLKGSPTWQPGIKDGQPIRIRYKLPINFQMVK